MHYRLADYVLWIVTPLVLAGVLLAMYRRGLHRRYPFFVAYTILQVASAVILATLAATSYAAYYHAYYCNLVLSTVISFCVLWEIARGMLGPARWSEVGLFVVLCAVVLEIAVLGLFVIQKSLPGGILTECMMLFDRTLRVFQLVVMLALISFSNTLKVFFKSVTFGLTLGFVLFGMTNMLVATAASHHGFMTTTALSRINSIAYSVTTFIWLLYVIFGLKDGNGRKRARFLPSPDADDRPRPKPPARWFFREGLFGSRAAARG